MPANVHQLIARQCGRNALAGVGQRWLEVERAMGIENTAREPIITCNQNVTNLPERCARFSCEKPRHTSQRQPMRPFETNTDGAAPTEQVVLYNPMLPVANGAVGLAELGFIR